MTLQSSGAISLGNVNVELGRSSTATISLGETAVRTLAGVASGAIALSNLYGKSAMSVTASNVYGSEGGFASAGSVSSSGSPPSPVVTGGTSPYTYSWVHTGTTSGNTPYISNPSSANPVWDTVVQDYEPSISTWRLTVTSSGGSSAQVTITVELWWTNLN